MRELCKFSACETKAHAKLRPRGEPTERRLLIADTDCLRGERASATQRDPARLTTPHPSNTIYLIAMKHAIRAFSLLALASLVFFGAETYQKPPKAIEDILNSPTTPTLTLSPTHAYAMQGSPVRYPPIAELSAPMLRLAGIRINPKTNGLHNATFKSNLLLRKIPEGTEIKMALPPNPKLEHRRAGVPMAPTSPSPTPRPTGSNLGLATRPRARRTGCRIVRINEVFGGGRAADAAARAWRRRGAMDGRRQVAAGHMPCSPIAEPRRRSRTVPAGPAHLRKAWAADAARATHEDLLQNPHDEDLFEYYATSQLAVVDSVSGA